MPSRSLIYILYATLQDICTMKKLILQILLTSYVLELTRADNAHKLSEPVTQRNHNGSKRSYCPMNAYVGNQPINRYDSSLRLRQLRSEMVRVAAVQGPALDGYIITSDDEHQSENVDPRDMRREFLTGFYGSAGDVVITVNKAILWTDGRYHIQADHQLDCNWILMRQGQLNVPTITEWLIDEFQNRTEVRIGANPKLISAFIWEILEKELVNTPIQLIAVHQDLIDLIWQVGRPAYNSHTAYPLADEYSGKPWQEKIQDIRLEMEFLAADALVITALDEIAWLFNIRGYDLPHTPVLRAYAIVTHRSLHLYVSQHKILRSVNIHLKTDSCFHADCVKLHNYSAIWYDLKTMAQVWNMVWLPSPCGYTKGASKKIYDSIPFEKRLVRPSPLINLRAEKNEIEAMGMRKSHLKDAVAMCDFMAYMEEQYELDSEGWDELQVARVANEFRYEQDGNRGIAFPTVVGYGPHGALPHYEPINLTNVKIGTTSTLVIDSGGQYLDGTTDVTRTLHFGKPTDEQKQAYTRVLIGSIELSSMIFPSDLTTDQLDTVARRPLWNVGYDYMHGTGHGIGHFSSVHESPVSISYIGGGNLIAGCNSAKLKPGFFLSNEPGYYKEGDFGVRLENILEVISADTTIHGVNRRNGMKFLKFRDITLIPYEPKLININMLNPSQRRWLNYYNKRIRDEVGAELKKRLKMKAFYWMMTKTTTIPEVGSSKQEFFSSYACSITSIFKQFHNLIATAVIYHITAMI